MNIFIKALSTSQHRKTVTNCIHDGIILQNERIHIFHPTVSPMCWRCNPSLGSLLHVWLNCIHIKPFWEKVHNTISKIITYTLDFTPAHYLLHHTSLPQSTYRRSLMLHLINAAKQCIPLYWRNTNPPKISNWLKRIEKIAEMEDFIFR